MNQIIKHTVLASMWLTLAAFGIWWTYDILTREDRINAIYEEGDRKLEAIHERELKNNCADPDPTYREMFPDSCIGWEKYAQ